MKDSSMESLVVTEVLVLVPKGSIILMMQFSAMSPKMIMVVCLLTISVGRLICMVVCSLMLSKL